MNYRFVKIKDTKYNLEYSWILECKDVETLMEHTQKYMGSTISNGVEDWFDKQKQSCKLSDDYTYVPHYTTRWAGICENFAKLKGTGFIQESVTLENTVLQGKLKQLFNGRTLYLRENGSYMIDSDSHEIINKIVTDKMVYPAYTEENISIKKWDGGTHYYAKIGNMDVVDEDGNQKWDTYDEAYQKALEELKTLK